ncbi:DNA-formamidopyrimidine glycosylase [Gracilibacillus sp. YIM 98692]|uniref:DNA-formamidopyrimidine glycosylase n=1 Tax=Gracilibacillus sp. YIM 98692 TaxID=2663532 RepID=UPI0013D5C53C|nr:DNA-formamidopyrimidine glycosylase [Gracilibacillus sp. YIM 98692]
MPELPEVETIRQTLKQLVIGKQIKDIEIKWPKIIKQPDDIGEFKQRIIKQTIQDIRRKGKFLLFDLDHDVIVSHLRMEGKYGVYHKNEPYIDHTHIIFHFTDDRQLRYRDVRKFGTMHLWEKGTEHEQKPLNQLAKDPIAEDFSLKEFTNKVQKSDRSIKNILLDQSVIAGLGNIYVDETLFLAAVHPLTKGSELSKKQIKKILEAAIQTLEMAIKQGGTTIRSYVNSQGQIGMFQQQLHVYGKQGESCTKCQTHIEKVKVSGRGTHFCPVCQKV